MADHNDDDDYDTVNMLEALALAPAPISARHVLGHEALSHALTRKTRALLLQSPRVVIVQVPNADWVAMMAKAVVALAPKATVKSVDDVARTRGAEHRVGSDALHNLQTGRSVVFVSQDPTAFLDETVLAAADATITIAPMTAALLRKAIRRVSSKTARGVTTAMASLPLPVILSAIRPGLTAGACVDNLDRALKLQPKPPVSTVPLLTDLPLTTHLRNWTDQTLADLAEAKAGTLAADQLVYAIFEGKPGTGKTLMAESLARTAEWAFISSSVGDWFTRGDGALGGVARNLRDFVENIIAAEPCIGFLDELDSLPDRATMDSRGRDWWTPIVTLFLTEIDRLRKSGKRVMLIGGTNYYSRLDSALVRAGRLQQQVTFLTPQTPEEVTNFLRYFLKADLPDQDLLPLARFALGATPATIEGWVQQARAKARAAGRPLAVEDVLAQIVPEDTRTPADIRAVALHEVGHALVSHRLGHVVEAVSIVAEGASGGHTRSTMPSIILDLEQIRDMATIMLAGRAADIALGNGAHAGAQSDLEMATQLLLAAHERQGLGDSLIYMPALNGRASAAVADAVARDMRALLDRAITMVAAEREAAYGLAERLIIARVISGKELAEYLGDRPRALGPARRLTRNADMRSALP